MTATINPMHLVEAALVGMPIARRDALTSWMWGAIPRFEDWTPALLDAAIAAVEG